MKTPISFCLALAALFSLSACSTTIEERHGHSSHSASVTTEETTVHHEPAMGTSTETHTVRTY